MRSPTERERDTALPPSGSLALVLALAPRVDPLVRRRAALRRPGALSSLALTAILLAACGGVGGSTPTPPASEPAASPLAPGTYTSRTFVPAVTYTLPGGWSNPEDTPAYFHLAPVGSDSVGVYIFRDAVAMSQDASCPDSPVTTVGKSARELATWMSSLPGVVASDPKPATVGGLSGFVIDLGIKSTWKQSCPFANGLPTAPLFLNPTAGFHWVMAGTERLRLYLLDLPAGGTLFVDIDAFDGSLIDRLLNEATPIVSSMTFAKA